ncbi:GNAT family N-acetyltransferase [Clostridium sp. CS001]|uniref:GNAT family N-acetyltransferase n=1 Tax=Clostridium sp. CS001 TaxID=2880648 RepID=UPI001CF4A241|nr:GNAT family N-acetyltransferase [Clostridium sp. CS001]MCB2290870.1 GNAT family N-acetyltransferase [Clostridium sp. CS001]
MILETERLIIRGFNHEDIDLIYDINNDPECIRYNSWDSMSYEDCQKDIKKWIGQYSNFPGTGVFCVEDKNEKTKIGMAFIVKTSKDGEFEIGFRLRKMCWYKGYAKEITRGYINYSRNKLNANSVIAEVYADNLKSRNVFEKLGFLKFRHPSGEDGLVYRYDLNTSTNA